MLEARIEMRLEPQLNHNWIMVTIDMGVDSVETLEQLSNKGRECLGKGNAWNPTVKSTRYISSS